MLFVSASALFFVAVFDVVRGSTDLPEVPAEITIHKVISDWDEAYLECNSEGAVLASPINTELLNAMKTLIGVNNTPYFIGTRSRENSRSYRSVEGVPLQNMTAAVLQMVQHLDPHEGNCLSMDAHSIRVVPCWIRLPFLCYRAQIEHTHATIERTNLIMTPTTQKAEINVRPITDKAELSVTPTTKKAEQNVRSTTEKAKLNVRPTTEKAELNVTPTTEKVELNTTTTSERAVHNATTTERDVHSHVCGAEGYKYNVWTGSCYKLHKDFQTWDDAALKCVSEGGYLVVINDHVEAMAIQNLGLKKEKPYTFIGLRDYASNNYWKTVERKSIDDVYHDWDSPNRYVGDDCGVVLPSGKLESSRCSYNTEYVCEIRPSLRAQ